MIELSFAHYLKQHPTHSFDNHHTLLYQGEIPRYVYIIKSGVVKVYTISHSGDERIITYYSSSDILPCEWIFNKTPASLYFYETVVASEVYCLRKQELLDLAYSDSSVARELLFRIATMYVGSNIHINAIEQSRASDKVSHILMYVAMQFGAISSDKVYQVDVKLSQQQFANMVGLARETTTIEFGKLKKKGIVEYSGGIYKIHLARLQELMGEDDVRTINLQ